METEKYKLYTYKMTHDTRFAPNPLFGILTLATCKPNLRKKAQIGEWISGWTSTIIAHTPTPVGKEKLIYLAKITQKLTFNEYWGKYPEKRSVNTYDTSILERYGDNIYEPCTSDPLGFRQITNINHHNNEKNKDLKGKYVLICKEFYYFSCLSPLEIPVNIRPKIPNRHPSGMITLDASVFINYVRKHREECEYSSPE